MSLAGGLRRVCGGGGGALDVDGRLAVLEGLLELELARVVGDERDRLRALY